MLSSNVHKNKIYKDLHKKCDEREIGTCPEDILCYVSWSFVQNVEENDGRNDRFHRGTHSNSDTFFNKINCIWISSL